MELSLHLLRMVVAVARRQSFTAAAEDLHLSQSALSRAVNDAERRLGVRLFQRTTRTVVLTPEGTELVRIAERIGAAHDQGMRQFRSFLVGTSGAIQIAALPSLAALVVPPLVARFRAEAPDARIRIKDGLSAYVIELVQTGEADLAITVDSDLPAELAFRRLTTDRFFCLHPPDHRFAGRTSVPWRDLREETFIAFSERSSVRHFTDRAFATIDVRPQETVEAQNVAAITGLVAAGLGVAAVPGFVLPLTQFAPLGHTPLVGPTLKRSIGMLWDPTHPRSPIVERFAATLERTH